MFDDHVTCEKTPEEDEWAFWSKKNPDTEAAVIKEEASLAWSRQLWARKRTSGDEGRDVLGTRSYRVQRESKKHYLKLF